MIEQRETTLRHFAVHYSAVRCTISEPLTFTVEASMILSVKTHERTELIDVTSEVNQLVKKSGTDQGLCMVYVPHTTAGVTINESADPSVKTDMLMVLNQMVPWEANYRHLEGNSPAHVKSTLVGASELIAIEKGRLVLGTWQGIFFCEFDGPRNRKLHVRIVDTHFVK
jgi:secondary thiamine-phosphate synthase enzyme